MNYLAPEHHTIGVLLPFIFSFLFFDAVRVTGMTLQNINRSESDWRIALEVQGD